MLFPSFERFAAHFMNATHFDIGLIEYTDQQCGDRDFNEAQFMFMAAVFFPPTAIILLVILPVEAYDGLLIPVIFPLLAVVALLPLPIVPVLTLTLINRALLLLLRLLMLFLTLINNALLFLLRLFLLILTVILRRGLRRRDNQPTLQDSDQ